MGTLAFLRGGLERVAAPVVAPLTPFSPQDALTTIAVEQLWPEHDASKIISRETALRIPAVKRAHNITCAVLSRMPWVQYIAGGERAPEQPRWLYTSGTGIAPRTLRWGVVSDLFMSGWAAIGFELDDNEQPVDALHIPRDWWSIDATTGAVDVDERVPEKFRRRVILIPLGYGANGMLTDALGSIRAARAIEAAYQDRVDNPTAHTVLTLNGDRWDGWLPEERAEFRDLWVKGRQAANGAVSLKPDWVSVDYPGAIATELFESARNGVRLDIANHADIPAGLLEGSKQGGGTDIKYSGVGDNGATRNELWDYGLAKYADAIEARLSLDDACAAGEYIRVDSSEYLTSPNATAPAPSQD